MKKINVHMFLVQESLLKLAPQHRAIALLHTKRGPTELKIDKKGRMYVCLPNLGLVIPVTGEECWCRPFDPLHDACDHAVLSTLADVDDFQVGDLTPVKREDWPQSPQFEATT